MSRLRTRRLELFFNQKVNEMKAELEVKDKYKPVSLKSDFNEVDAFMQCSKDDVPTTPLLGDLEFFSNASDFVVDVFASKGKYLKLWNLLLL